MISASLSNLWFYFISYDNQVFQIFFDSSGGLIFADFKLAAHHTLKLAFRNTYDASDMILSKVNPVTRELEVIDDSVLLAKYEKSELGLTFPDNNPTNPFVVTYPTKSVEIAARKKNASLGGGVVDEVALSELRSPIPPRSQIEANKRAIALLHVLNAESECFEENYLQSFGRGPNFKKMFERDCWKDVIDIIGSSIKATIEKAQSKAAGKIEGKESVALAPTVQQLETGVKDNKEVKSTCSRKSKKEQLQPSKSSKLIKREESESNDPCRFVIIGSPGIGKSIFSGYLVGSLVKYGIKRFTYKVGSFEENYCLDATSGKWIFARDAEQFELSGDWSDYVYVADPSAADDVPPVISFCHNIIITSPNIAHHRDIEKYAGSFRTLFLPVYTERELQQLNTPEYTTKPLDPNELIERFLVVGGAPRYIFDDSEVQNFKENISMLDAEQCNDLQIGRPSFAQEQISNRIFHLFCKEDEDGKNIYDQYERYFCSDEVKRLFLVQMGTQKDIFQIEFCIREILVAERLRGSYFKDQVIQFFCLKERKLSCWKLHKTAQPSKVGEILFPKLSLINFESEEFHEAAMKGLFEQWSHPTTLFRPESQTNKTFDFYCLGTLIPEGSPSSPVNCAFGCQVTVAKTHDLIMSGIIDFYEGLRPTKGYGSKKKEMIKILFIVPEGTAHTLRIQNVVSDANSKRKRDPGLEQYVVEVDLKKLLIEIGTEKA